MEQNLVKPGPKAPHSANWKPGQSGNLNGRPAGVRNAFSTAELFCASMAMATLFGSATNFIWVPSAAAYSLRSTLNVVLGNE